MKILKIEFENINSLRGKHKIDFTQEPFKTNALFAITGPTGSGKSSILDVIALALFNQVPRLGRITRNEILSKGAILTRNQKQAQAAVTYSCKSGNFISSWSISTNRNDNLRDYDMELRNVNTGALFDLKKSDIPAKNEELIGLNYNQFIKSVLLAQGEFAQFLQAKKDERGALLEKITGTGIYRRLGQLAYEKFKLENQEIKIQQETIAIKTEELLRPEASTTYKKELAEHEKAIAPLGAAIENLQKKISLKEAISRQEKETQSAEEKLVLERKNLLFFDKNQGISLQSHDKVEPLAQQITQWNQHRERREELRAEEKQIREDEKRLAENKKKLQHQIFSFVKEEIPIQNIPTILREFAAKVDKLQQERQEKRSQHRALKQQFESSIKATGFSLGNALETDLIELENRIKRSENSLKTLKIDLKEVDLARVENEKKRLRDSIKSLGNALGIQEKIETFSSALKKTQTEINYLNEQLQRLPKEIELATANKQRYKAEQERLKTQQQNERLHASLAQHREHLTAGAPCPLCGALEHPLAKETPLKSTNLQEALTEAENAFTLWSTKSVQHKTELERAQKDKTIGDNTLQTQQQELKNQEEALQMLLKERNLNVATSWQQEAAHAEHQLENLELYESEKRYHDVLTEGYPLLEKMQEIVYSGKDLSIKIAARYTGNDIYKDTQALQNRWISLAENANNNKSKNREIQQKLDKTNENLEKTAINLLPKIKLLDFETIADAKGALLEHSIYTHLRAERENLNQRITDQEASLKTLQKQVVKNKEEDTPLTAADLHKKLKNTKDKQEELRLACEDLKRQLKNDEERREDIANLHKKISEKEKEIKRWRLLNELIGDANGKRFNEFAQHLTLTQLLRLANTRLKDLSDRYRLDTPQEEEDESLVAIDEHMGGQRRSVKTLSGGETFILSLSMALALSDLASRNVEINSLFIDEGFGTLDPETLDQTLDTLERLQAASSKTIGIISHVDSLKERIATQIQLKRNGQGYSSLKII